MKDYSELVNALLYCVSGVCKNCSYFEKCKKNGTAMDQLHNDAAAAIEELQQIAAHYEQSAKDWWQEAREYKIKSAEGITAEESKELIKRFKSIPCGPIEQLPKRGEIVRCKECIHFTQGGWCDREFDWFPVDENDFCSMAEKM